MKIKLELPVATQLIRKKGLSKDGAVQAFHTQNVLRRIVKYMPYRSGATIKLTIAQTDIQKPQIVTDAPYAKYLYYGKVMVDSVTGKGPANIPNVGFRFRKNAVLKATDRDLVYTNTKNPQAGPYWDRALVAHEGTALVADLQRFIESRR